MTGADHVRVDGANGTHGDIDLVELGHVVQRGKDYTRPKVTPIVRV